MIGPAHAERSTALCRAFAQVAQVFGTLKRRRAMTQVMQPDGRQASLGRQLPERPGQPVRRHRIPVKVGEDEPALPASSSRSSRWHGGSAATLRGGLGAHGC